MDERSMMLFRSWSGEDLTDWWASEKLDGVRAYWDGERLWTRSGNAIPAPAWFTEQLPRGVHMDGELTCGRRTFATASNAARNGVWTLALRLAVFDLPLATGGWLDRMQRADDLLDGCPIAQPIDRWPITSLSDMHASLARILDGGGEGLVARQPHAPYCTGRSAAGLKIKRASLPLF